MNLQNLHDEIKKLLYKIFIIKNNYYKQYKVFYKIYIFINPELNTNFILFSYKLDIYFYIL